MKKRELAYIEAPFLKKDTPTIRSGDILEVITVIQEGEKERLQAFEGIVISYRRRGISSSVVLRKHSHGEAVERKFLLHSPMVRSIKRKKMSVVRRAKLYYLRGREGRAARVEEKIVVKSKDKK